MHICRSNRPPPPPPPCDKGLKLTPPPPPPKRKAAPQNKASAQTPPQNKAPVQNQQQSPAPAQTAGPQSNPNGVAPTASPGDLGASDINQSNLEARFQALYVAMMEKQVSFKEAVEPFKTDNQNAGKG